MAHFHQDASHDGGQHENREGKQEEGAYGEHRRNQHHKERKHGEEVVVAIATRGEQADNHHEKDEVHRGRDEGARDHEVVGNVKSSVDEGQGGSEFLGNDKDAACGQQVSADEKRNAHENNRERAQAAAEGQGRVSGQQQDI